MNACAASIRGFVQQHIRAHRPVLSTGAYGDEGDVLLEIECLMFDAILRGSEEHYQMGQAWARNLPTSILSQELRDGFAYIAETIVCRTNPRRLTMPTAELSDRRECLFAALTTFGDAPASEHMDVFQRYAGVIESRGVISVERGGEEWRFLHRRDLLWIMAPFVVETEPSLVHERVAIGG